MSCLTPTHSLFFLLFHDVPVGLPFSFIYYFVSLMFGMRRLKRFHKHIIDGGKKKEKIKERRKKRGEKKASGAPLLVYYDFILA